MKNRQFIGWVAGIPLLVIALIVIILMHESPTDGITRAMAAKAAALAITSRSECEKMKEDSEKSHFKEADRENWYVKYMDFLYDKGYLTEGLTPADDESTGDLFTYGEAQQMAAALSPALKSKVSATKRNREKPIPVKEWWDFYRSMLEYTDKDNLVEQKEIQLYGTPKNVDNAKGWLAYTDQGDLGFEGLALDSYIDCKLDVLTREGEIIAVMEFLGNEVIYRNVWLADGGDGMLLVYVGSITREIEAGGDMVGSGEFVNNVADIYLTGGKLKKIVVKRDTIAGKVLAVREDAIEVEGYGALPLSPGFQVFKTYGTFEEKKPEDILVGYDLQKFVVEDGKICGALIERTFDAKTVRVLIMDTDFKSFFHQSLNFSSDGSISLFYGNKMDEAAQVIPAGEVLSLTPGDERLQSGRLILRPESGREIQVHTIERALDGPPAYAGRLEVSQEEEGLTLVNELYLEDYLIKVVPSEMPGSYEKEALKAQAVCARTYAYRQILTNGYSRYGAHFDDSTGYQVYNNMVTDARTDSAVKETYGKILLYEGNPIEAFYFSTSCGTTTDGSVWGSDASQVPYIHSVALRESRETLRLTDNSEFTKFIKNTDYWAYDSDFPLYRWQVTTDSAILAQKIDDVGKIQSIEISERGPGGIARKMTVKGSQGSRTFTGQNSIRGILGNSSLELVKKDGKKMSTGDRLPSAFLTVEAKGSNEQGENVFKIYGGGNGHGAGMSQNGAQGMAKNGKNYEQILKFFYEGVEIAEIGSEKE